jgi:hypothetical protein
MVLPELSYIKTVTITIIAVCGILIISPTYVTAAVEASNPKLNQSQTDKAYLNCWNNLQCRQHINQKFNATNLPDCLDTKDVGICYDSSKHQVQQ